jgi:hypothetical protein
MTLIIGGKLVVFDYDALLLLIDTIRFDSFIHYFKKQQYEFRDIRAACPLRAILFGNNFVTFHGKLHTASFFLFVVFN